MAKALADRNLHKASLVTIGAVLGAVVALALIFVITILRNVQSDPSLGGDPSKDAPLNESDRSGAHLSGPDGITKISAVSPSEDLEIAWEALTSNLSDIAQLESFLKVAQIWVEKDGIKVLDHISATVSDTTVRDAIIASVLHSVALGDPQTALQQALELKGASRRFALQTIIEVWATTDPQAALAGVSILESSCGSKDFARGNLESLGRR